MAIDELNKIDIIGVENATGIVKLTISDHLDWLDELGHLKLLQEKINAYLLFVESGEIFKKYPEAIGRAVTIEVVMKYPPSENFVIFFDTASRVVNEAGFGLTYEVFP